MLRLERQRMLFAGQGFEKDLTVHDGRNMARSAAGNKSKPPAVFGLRPRGGGARLPPVKIGVLSDTHNHLRESRFALDALVKHGATHLVHCGDAGEEVVELLAAVCLEHGLRAHVALGNCDRGHGDEFRFAPQPAGVERGVSPEFILDGKRCVAVHGDNAHRLENVSTSGEFDYVFTGHTHARAERRIGKTRVLNPGSPVRPRGGPPSVALLDLDTGEVRWLVL
ncbi:MAG: YfcE family phosphodiesterase [Opitutae bacterium]|nr:YfcE family phosphodiesterase [Opitutae bacterium]